MLHVPQDHALVKVHECEQLGVRREGDRWPWPKVGGYHRCFAASSHVPEAKRLGASIKVARPLSNCREPATIGGAGGAHDVIAIVQHREFAPAREIPEPELAVAATGENGV